MGGVRRWQKWGGEGKEVKRRRGEEGKVWEKDSLQVTQLQDLGRG